MILEIFQKCIDFFEKFEYNINTGKEINTIYL